MAERSTLQRGSSADSGGLLAFARSKPSKSRLTRHADAGANTQGCSEKLENSLVVCNLVENGAHKKTHNAGKDESGAIVGDISPVADPELPEDHPELHQVGLGVLVLEAEGGRPLLGNTQLLNQLLIFPAHANVQISSSGACCGATLRDSMCNIMWV